MLLFAVLCFPLHCQIFTFLPAVRCSYNKSNADVTPRSLTLLDYRKGRVDFTEGKLRRPGHSRLSATPLITSHFYSAARTSDWPGLRVIVFLMVRSEHPVPPLPRHLAGIPSSQRNLSPSQKAVIYQLEWKTVWLRPMICWAEGSSMFLVHEPFSKRFEKPKYVHRFETVYRCASPAYIHVFWIRGKLIIRTIMHALWSSAI